jgi:hypothetical protein
MAFPLALRDFRIVWNQARRNACCLSPRASALRPQRPASPAAMSSAVEVREQITLTDKEKEIFETLIAAAKHANTGTVLRCAGGWVRDKLLGKDSLDIDIALDNMMGREFAEQVNEYLKSQGRETRSAAVIHSNPDQSKHLETARMKISDVWIDLVNLRSETYAEESRIPTMEFGTPEQDALRRDFTFNALFYNINEGAVEDLTGRGLEDLRAGVLRTPLPPSVTFLDGGRRRAAGRRGRPAGRPAGRRGGGWRPAGPAAGCPAGLLQLAAGVCPCVAAGRRALH